MRSALGGPRRRMRAWRGGSAHVQRGASVPSEKVSVIGQLGDERPLFAFHTKAQAPLAQQLDRAAAGTTPIREHFLTSAPVQNGLRQPHPRP
jgi:hypothetical protein